MPWVGCVSHTRCVLKGHHQRIGRAVENGGAGERSSALAALQAAMNGGVSPRASLARGLPQPWAKFWVPVGDGGALVVVMKVSRFKNVLGLPAILPRNWQRNRHSRFPGLDRGAPRKPDQRFRTSDRVFKNHGNLTGSGWSLENGLKPL